MNFQLKLKSFEFHLISSWKFDEDFLGFLKKTFEVTGDQLVERKSSQNILKWRLNSEFYNLNSCLLISWMNERVSLTCNTNRACNNKEKSYKWSVISFLVEIALSPILKGSVNVCIKRVTNRSLARINVLTFSDLSS